MELLNRVIGLLPSVSILFSAFLCAIVPMCFYWISDRMRKHDPPWKHEMPDDIDGSMLPAGSSNDQYEDIS
ncbi:hypothetical protein SAMN05216378_3812 [Paenibacillus catalpae]|uniref:Uncharacterized protein n=1 Tax=Paenibacillus catalpae TaxID=1045775 RepID=A0A1I2CT29_9BACL|nr:hypothetical protein SAMN05216378_3812 [Paenibacillus catalpae]